jgi:YD repeat-containing protein
MKKQIFTTLGLFLIFTLSSCSSDDDNGDINNGKKYLAEIVVKEHEWKFGERQQYGAVYERYTYNEKGKITKFETNYYIAVVKSRIPRSIVYSYDEKDRITEKNEYELSLLQYKYKYEYNSFDSVSIMYEYSRDGSLNRTHKYEYDSNRRLSKETEIVNYMRNDYGYIHTYEYNGNTVIITQRMLDDGSLFGKTVNEYDSHNNIVKSSWTDGDTGKTTSSIYKYEYDSKGRVIKKTSPDGFGKNDEQYRDYSYNDDGSIHIIHLSNNHSDNQSDLEYTYTYK